VIGAATVLVDGAPNGAVFRDDGHWIAIQGEGAGVHAISFPSAMITRLLAPPSADSGIRQVIEGEGRDRAGQ
jgi:hypothetical protein